MGFRRVILFMVIALSLGTFGLGLSVRASSTLLAKPNTERPVGELAISLLGKPYKAGGTTPDGFDTSGFVQYVYKIAAGANLPRTAKDQYNQGISIKKEDLLLADLVFFKINGKIQSVGIYIGQCWLGDGIYDENCFVTVTSKGIKVQNLLDSYWKKNYYGARRIIHPSEATQKLLNEIYSLAKQKKVPKCEFKIGTSREKIVKKWGKPSGAKDKGPLEYTERGISFYFNDKNCVDCISVNKFTGSFSDIECQKILGKVEMIFLDGTGGSYDFPDKISLLIFGEFHSSWNDISQHYDLGTTEVIREIRATI